MNLGVRCGEVSRCDLKTTTPRYTALGVQGRSDRSAQEQLVVNLSHPNRPRLKINPMNKPFEQTQSAVEMDPAMADAWSNLGSAYHHENDLEDALGWCAADLVLRYLAVPPNVLR